ncbi:LAGLIDADG family homing endonuclease [Nocardiopsis terrae]
MNRNGRTECRECLSIRGREYRERKAATEGRELRGPHGKIADDAPMSNRTEFRRRAEAGQTQPVFHYPWNDTFFDDWSDSMAWVVGLIWSDGCLTKNMVEVCSKDSVLIEMIEGLIEQPHGMRLKNGGRHLRINFSSKHAADRLRDMGLTEAKSYTIGWPVDMPEEYSGAFVRGLLDGDGCMYLHLNRKGQQTHDLRVELVSASEALVGGMTAWLDRHEIRHSVTPRRNSVFKVLVTQQAALRRLHGLLYPNEGVCCLFRKRINFDLWMTQPRARTGRPAKN